MASNNLSKSQFLVETNLAEPVQIITKPEIEYNVKTLPYPVSYRRWQIVWRNVMIFLYLHYATFYGLYYTFALGQWKTIIFGKYSYFVNKKITNVKLQVTFLLYLQVLE